MKVYLWITLIIGMAFYLFWDKMPEGYFFYGNALFIFLLCSYIFFRDRNSFISFYLFSLSLSNLIDELKLDNTKLNINEIVLLIILPIIWYLKNKKNASKK